MKKKRNIGILIFNNAEVLDFAGPFEVFSVTSELNNHELFDVFTVAQTIQPITAVNGLSVNPNYDFSNCPPVDVLIVSGGFGTRKLVEDKHTLDWISQVHKATEYTLSICSGSMLLGAIGILDHQPYCTHHQVYDLMTKLVPTGLPQKNKRFVNFDNVYTSGGISAGIDLSFHMVEKLHGEHIANNTAKYMEYER